MEIMSCNSCAKPYSLLRKEKGCPSCGFSFCSKCLIDKIFLPKLNTEARVCAKCKRARDLESKEQKKIKHPNAYYKSLNAKSTHTQPSGSSAVAATTYKGTFTADDEIQKRLLKLKQDQKQAAQPVSEDEIAQRLTRLKGELPKTSDAELQERLARLRGVTVDTCQSKPTLTMPDLRTEQEQADDLMKQYMAQASIDDKYKNEFDSLVVAMESRLNKLKDTANAATSTKSSEILIESEDEDDTVRKIIEKVKADTSLEKDVDAESRLSGNDELPFCEICNENAKMRCLGCKYLFCKPCFLDHKDDDDGCDRYEPYTAPTSK